MRTFDVCGVPVSSTNIEMACGQIDSWIKNRSKAYVCVAPASTIVDAQSDSRYKRILQNAHMVTPDGMPLVWIGKFKKEPDLARTYGPDLMLAVCEKGQDKGYKHFFYGGTQSTCNLLQNALKDKFPRIDIVGVFAPPFHAQFTPEKEDVIKEINRLKPDILWIGLGSPKQDYWMDHHRLELDVPVIVGVGAAFDFIAGTKPQAPKWMRQRGLEWAFRLGTEPKRLWRRYLIGNTKFIFYLIKDIFKKK